MPDSSSVIRVKAPTTVIYPFDLTKSWVPLPPGIAGLRAAPAPLPDDTYGQVITPAALLRPYQERVILDAVVKVGFKEQRLEYPLTLPTRTDTMRIRAIGKPTIDLGTYASTLAPKVKAVTVSRKVFRAVSLAPKVTFARLPLFNVMDLSPSAWLDASDSATITLDSGGVYQWNDKSGNGSHFKYFGAYDSTKVPTVAAAAQNGKDVLRFDGTDDWLVSVRTFVEMLSITPVGAGTFFDFTVMIAAKPTDVQTDEDYLWTNNDALWRVKNMDTSLRMRTLSGGTVIFQNYNSAPWAINTSKIATLTGTTPTTLYLNTTDYGTGSYDFSGGYYVPELPATTEMYLGSSGPVGPWIGMDLYEVIIVPRKITSTERSNAVAYLADKWGITL